MKVLTIAEVHKATIPSLGLDAGLVNLESDEAIASALRRAAAFLCPCSARTLVNSVSQSLRGLVPDQDNLVREKIENLLQSLMEYGDLKEFDDVAADSGHTAASLIYVAPPSFVRWENQTVFIIGVPPDNVSLLPDEIQQMIEYEQHIRRIPGASDEKLHDRLLELGFVQISEQAWIGAPQQESSSKHIQRFDLRLDMKGSSGEIQELHIIDLHRSVKYYRGRWVDPTNQTGRFVGRRPQLYGNDIWCYIELIDGKATRLMDLPLSGSRYTGYDEAWRLQMAIDAERGAPQQFRTREASKEFFVLDVFSPLPTWVKRRWDALGTPIRPHECLISYKLPIDAFDVETNYLRENIWLSEFV